MRQGRKDGTTSSATVKAHFRRGEKPRKEYSSWFFFGLKLGLPLWYISY